ncbi:SDR family NAD(P)-dependent oxidoreductase [Janibacter terrae]|uniref:SDR family NAD(P)-dependent oxidoreductase n=1 Tax=Janibacter terrae TaxID=103817 RepID=UPI0008383C3D|nr:SDR family NAD(P)-dependent oxidoreductase [Janibacter terrae]
MSDGAAETTTRPLSGRVALVTGASTGIGLAAAQRLSRDGMRVALLARNEAALTHAAATLPGESLVLPTDVTDSEQLDAAYRTVEQTWGPVEVLVLSAGNGIGAPLAETTDEDWQRMLDLNLTAPFRCLRRALPGMLERGWGRVVVVASIAAKVGDKQVAAYTASKHGVLGLVRSAAAELASTGVTVNAVCPGYVDTPMTDQSVADIAERSARSQEEVRRLLERKQPIRRLVTAQEVADVVALCVANGAINAQGINVDGGAVQS